LATDLALKPEGASIFSNGSEYRRITLPTAFIGSMPVDLRSSSAFVHLGSTSFDQRDKVEGLLPGKALERYQVVVDYARSLFSVGESESLPHRGEALPCPFVALSGHPRIELEIDGATYGFLLDIGTSITLTRRDVLQKWSRQHAQWPTSIGAAGPANEVGVPDANAFLIRVPALQLGAFTVPNVAMASRSNETFSSATYETPAPIIGALGGNVLRQFRVEIDYPRQLLFLEPQETRQPPDFDTVGLVLYIDDVNRLVVGALSSSASKVTRRNVLPGDVILQINGLSEVHQSLLVAAKELSGTVGEQKELRILRNGKSMNVTAVVARIL
jgi:hypothetical protein